MAVYKWRRQQTENFGEVWVPYAHIAIQTADKRFQAFSLQIDSGATVSLLRRSVADLLGLDLEAGKRIELASVGGGHTVAYVHDLQTRFANDLAYQVPFAIADTESVPNLLGRLKVFDLLQIDFDATLDETRVTTQWLDQTDRRIWEFFIDTEKHILDRWKEIDLADPATEVARRFIERGAQNLAAVMGLIKLHRAYACHPFIRAMFELALQFEYLMQDPATRPKKYLDYTHITKYRQAKAIVENPSGPVSSWLASSPLREEGQKQLETEFNKVRSQFTIKDKKGKERLSSNWYCMSVAQLAETMGWESEYKLWYASGSAWSHGDPFSTQYPLPFLGNESKATLWACYCYYSRMLLRVAEKIILTSEQYNVLNQYAKKIG